MDRDLTFDTKDIREKAHRFKILTVLRSGMIGFLIAILTIVSRHS